MIASMTGFARRELSGPWGSLVCELRSVNHRFLESGFRLPEELRSVESDLRQHLGQAVRRGKLDCTIIYRPAQAAAMTLEVDAAALERLTSRLDELQRVIPLGSVDLLEVLRWPGVLKDQTTAGEELLAAVRELFDAAIGDLCAARSREGEKLRAVLEQRCESLEALVKQVQARLPDIHARLTAKIRDRIKELAAGADQDRLEQEIALLLQRLDVDEELERLSGHVAEIRRVLAGNEPAGRRLDFLMQELNREANTLSSKSQDLETTRAAVDMKVLIEQMREQVQNAE
ncbi:MAG: YicC/YloC family endoribonuclease [Steroidobacteraceae bacterium]